MKASDILIDIRTKQSDDNRREKAGMIELRFFIPEETDQNSPRFTAYTQLSELLDGNGYKKETKSIRYGLVKKQLKFGAYDFDEINVFKLMGNSNTITGALKLAVDSGFISHETVAEKLKADANLNQLQTEYYTTKVAPPEVRSSFVDKYAGQSSSPPKDSFSQTIRAGQPSTAIPTR